MINFRIDVITANRMCNFAIEFDIENKGLNSLCRASWLIDHDMFEVNIILILTIMIFYFYCICYFHRKLWKFWPVIMNGWLMINLGIGIIGLY